MTHQTYVLAFGERKFSCNPNAFVFQCTDLAHFPDVSDGSCVTDWRAGDQSANGDSVSTFACRCAIAVVICVSWSKIADSTGVVTQLLHNGDKFAAAT